MSTYNTIEMLRRLADGLESGTLALRDWHVDVQNINPVLDYTANMYLPETRLATEKHLTFEVVVGDRFVFTDAQGVRRVVE